MSSFVVSRRNPSSRSSSGRKHRPNGRVIAAMPTSEEWYQRPPEPHVQCAHVAHTQTHTRTQIQTRIKYTNGQGTMLLGRRDRRRVLSAHSVAVCLCRRRCLWWRRPADVGQDDLWSAARERPRIATVCACKHNSRRPALHKSAFYVDSQLWNSNGTVAGPAAGGWWWLGCVWFGILCEWRWLVHRRAVRGHEMNFQFAAAGIT